MYIHTYIHINTYTYTENLLSKVMRSNIFKPKLGRDRERERNVGVESDEFNGSVAFFILCCVSPLIKVFNVNDDNVSGSREKWQKGRGIRRYGVGVGFSMLS